MSIATLMKQNNPVVAETRDFQHPVNSKPPDFFHVVSENKVLQQKQGSSTFREHFLILFPEE